MASPSTIKDLRFDFFLEPLLDFTIKERYFKRSKYINLSNEKNYKNKQRQAQKFNTYCSSIF